MEEKLREELRAIWLMGSNGEITKEESRKRAKELIHSILEENPQRLLDLCKGHIGGLSDENLLKKAKDETQDFVFMNISAGSYHYSEIVKKPPNPDSREIKRIYLELLKILGLQDNEIQKLLNKTSQYDEYNSAPALTLLDILIEADICAAIDWKFGLEDVEYNLNLLAKKLNMAPIKEYPPYEEGQPLGYEALEMIMKECEHAAVVIPDGDELCVFLTSKENAPKIKAKLDELIEFWVLKDIHIVS